jgi:signal transduction histidine kinase
MNPIITPDVTGFAPAARADEDLLAWQITAFRSDKTAVALLEAMPGPAMVLNRQRQIVASNVQLQAMFTPADCESIVGMRPGEALGCVRAHERKTGCGTTPACAQCGAVQAILESLSTHGRAVKECRVRTSFRTGSGALNFRVFATYAEIGGEEMVVFALMDLSDEKRRRVLERTLLTDLRDECTEPMLAEFVRQGGSERVDESAFLQEFGDLSNRVLGQIEAHRHLLAAESGELVVLEQDVDIRDLLEKQAAACRQARVGRGRQVELRTEGRGSLRSDPVQLARIVDGLLRNALEATPEGGRVEVFAEHDGETFTLSLHNAGVIPLHVQQQIFQRSFSTRDGEGRGIGTYTVKLLVERYLDGSVEFTSDAAGGTVFTVVVPDRALGQRAA